ncbi:hypothetical protein EGY31_17265 [Burkholderia multivorans]|uniref:hypothetical protein n=1 Tax=Burkholderia ubonensis TaxID=101571 RepID=UPI000F7062E2|nr:hypothetical protein [Burkholderia ubonensis]AYZ65027.1 hypothetical protein EGY31_17265 [Burkholderia multivorans]VWB05808.1 hypothetical protein BUB20358_00073 [Burkholderia ubonensis]
MSERWYMRQPSPRTCGKPPALWVGFAIFVVIQVIGAVITVLTWGPRPVASTDFFVRLFILPLSVTVVLCGIVYSRHEQEATDTRWWNYLCRDVRSRWRRWAQQRVAIVSCTTITAEVNLGERMAGLEGAPPANSGKRLPLANEDQESSEARLEQVLTSLLTPLSTTIATLARARTLHVCLQSSTRDDLADLRQVWQRMRLASLVTFSWESLDAQLSIVEPWLDNEKPKSDFQLILACQLHAADRTPAWSEVAVALLTTSSAGLAAFRGKLKPMAYLFRPVSADADEFVDALMAVSRAEQVPADRIKRLWMCGLPGQLRNATVSAVKDCGFDLPTHNLDEAVGDPGPASPLLLHALAAQMVQHGQGVQLVATPAQSGVHLSLIGSQIAPIEPVTPEYYRLLSLSTTVGFVGVAGIVLFGADTLGVMRPWLGWSVLAALIAMIPLQAGAALLCRRAVTEDFYANL